MKRQNVGEDVKRPHFVNTKSEHIDNSKPLINPEECEKKVSSKEVVSVSGNSNNEEQLSTAKPRFVNASKLI